MKRHFSFEFDKNVRVLKSKFKSFKIDIGENPVSIELGFTDLLAVYTFTYA